MNQHILTSLTRHIALYSDKEFAFGKADCVIFCSDFIHYHTGIDYYENFRGKYNDAAGADTLIKKAGWNTILDAVDKHFIRRPAIQYANTGDIIAIQQNGRWILGLCAGSKVAFLTDVGITFIKLTRCAIAWVVDYEKK